VNSANTTPASMVLHIFVIHRPKFEENGRVFELAMNQQAFYREKQEEERE